MYLFHNVAIFADPFLSEWGHWLLVNWMWANVIYVLPALTLTDFQTDHPIPLSPHQLGGHPVQVAWGPMCLTWLSFCWHGLWNACTKRNTSIVLYRSMRSFFLLSHWDFRFIYSSSEYFACLPWNGCKLLAWNILSCLLEEPLVYTAQYSHTLLGQLNNLSLSQSFHLQ